MAVDVLAALTRSPKQERFMTDEELEALQASGLKGKALEKGANIVSGAASGEQPSEKTFEGAKAFVDQFEQKLAKKPEFQKAEPSEQKAIADAELQKTAKESMSDRELVGRLLIGFVPTLLGAAIGRASGLGTGLGGAAGGEAALAGLKQLDTIQEAQKKEAKEKAKEAADLKKLEGEKKKLELQESKEARETMIALRKLGLEKESLGLKEKELQTKVATGKQLPAAQYLAGTYARRVEQAESVFDALEQGGFDRASVESGLGSLLPEKAQSEALQSQNQAERNFVNAILRRESGAAISASEFESAEKQYFPRAGDSPAVVAQKRANRQQVMQGLKAEAGAALEQIPLVNVGQNTIAPMQTLSSGLRLPGQIQSAVAAEPPKRVIQNGIEYIYNPATGRYE